MMFQAFLKIIEYVLLLECHPVPTRGLWCINAYETNSIVVNILTLRFWIEYCYFEKYWYFDVIHTRKMYFWKHGYHTFCISTSWHIDPPLPIVVMANVFRVIWNWDELCTTAHTKLDNNAWHVWPNDIIADINTNGILPWVTILIPHTYIDNTWGTSSHGKWSPLQKSWRTSPQWIFLENKEWWWLLSKQGN